MEDSVSEGNGLLAIALNGVTQARLPAAFKKYHDATLVEFIAWDHNAFGPAIERAYQNRVKLGQHDATTEAASHFFLRTLLGQ